MLRTLGGALVLLALFASRSHAQNSADVVAGSDVALTGGAVVANVTTGGAMWFNPAGVARLDALSVDLTGSVLSYSIVRAPGTLSLETGEESAGEFSAVQAIPRALTFVLSPRDNLRWGLGFFFSRVANRYFQDRLISDEGATPSSDTVGAANQTRSTYHVSSAVGWERSQKLLVGGGMDIVVATQRVNETLAGGYDDGAGGAFSRSFNESLSGAGLQLKGGIQWAPMPKVRFGVTVATPSYLVFVNEERTSSQTTSPPGGPPSFAATQVNDLRGAWAGVESGLARAGCAWLESWGWLELDLVVRFPLQNPTFNIDWKTTADVLLGGVFRVTNRLKLGAGLFTDMSAQRDLDLFGESKFNYFGANVGVDFANRDKPPEGSQGGFYIAFTLAVRYSYGRGELAGVRVPASYQDPPVALNVVDAWVHDIGVNIAVKAAF